MRAMGLACVLAMSGACGAQAQVISGESTYEDNFVHTPPSSTDKPAGRDPAKSADPTSSNAPSRNGRERDRD